jgi:hypothetical protein
MQLVGHRCHLVRLERDDDDIVMAGVFPVIGGAHVLGDELVIVLHDDAHAAGADGLEIFPARNEGDLFARDRQFGPHKAAYGTGAHDTETHLFPRSRIAAPNARGR